MPHGGGVRFDADSAAYRKLRQWITDGTPWGDEHDPTLASIQVEPAERILAAGESQQLKVVARYSDGSTRDVSPTAEYFSQRPTHLTVSFDGLVHSLGERGDATVMVRYMGIVAVSRMTIPYTDKSPQSDNALAAAAGFEPKNFIDKLVLEKWRKLGLSPSPAASDAVFIRRAYLDAIGTLPTPQEVREFLADSSADKRDKLVDRLLDRPEYAVFWAQQWGDILRNKQVDGSHKAESQKFADWIRDAFAKNMPLRQIRPRADRRHRQSRRPSADGLVSATEHDAKPRRRHVASFSRPAQSPAPIATIIRSSTFRKTTIGNSPPISPRSMRWAMGR